jgi:hypothetical protein
MLNPLAGGKWQNPEGNYRSERISAATSGGKTLTRSVCVNPLVGRWRAIDATARVMLSLDKFMPETDFGGA